MRVGAIDLTLLACYLVGVVLFGIWVGRGARSLASYTVGDRNLPWWLLLVSIVATETSTVTFLSIPGFAFGRDMTWLQVAFGFLIGRFVVASLLLPAYFRGSFTSAYQVLRERFAGGTQIVASLLFIVTRSLADGLRLFLTAIVLEEMTGIGLPWAVAALGLATIAYTWFGGIKSVVWTDFVQYAIYTAGALVAFVLLLGKLPGGWSQLVEMGSAAGRLRIVDLSFDLSQPYALWAGVVGGVFVTMGSHGVDQLTVQRYLSARSLGDAQRALRLSGVVVLLQFALFLLIGVGLYCFYELFPPAVAFERTDRVFASFILDQMPVGVVGLLLGAIFAAAMSTLSSSLNSCATSAVSDLWLPLRGASAKPGTELAVTRWLTVGFGLVQIAVGIASQLLAASVVGAVLGIAAFTTGIVLGVYLLGMFAPRVGQRAALIALVVGLSGMTWVFFATPLAWTWYALVGSAGTVAAGVLASLVWPREAASVGARP